MKIQIDGTNTLNKGAELMLYSILQEIESTHPAAAVYYNPNNYNQPGEIKTGLKIETKKGYTNTRYIKAVFRKLNMSYAFLTPQHAKKGIDLLLDGGGFQFSDQWFYPKDHLKILENYYKTLKANGTKIVFLSQAFGPFEKDYSKKCVEIINKYADVIIAREKVSYDYVIKAGASPDKTWLYPDFTLLTPGVMPLQYESLRDSVCIIPNKKMISSTSLSANTYMDFIVNVIKYLKDSGEKVFLLNHEGVNDLKICEMINEKLDNTLTIAKGLDAIETKGIIGGSKLVISSRYHGVASALSQQVPCLATSWSHKYELLFSDYNQTDRVLNPEGNLETTIAKIKDTIENKDAIKVQLANDKKAVVAKTREMWGKIWQKI